MKKADLEEKNVARYRQGVVCSGANLKGNGQIHLFAENVLKSKA
jgi:hypothetical protein